MQFVYRRPHWGTWRRRRSFLYVALAQGGTDATASGALVTATASVIAGAIVADSQAAAALVGASASAIAGAADVAASGVTATATASPVVGSATASSEVAAVTVTATANPIAGSTSADYSAAGALQTATASPIAGAVSAAWESTPVTLTATASALAGAASADAQAQGVTNTATASALQGSPEASSQTTAATVTATATFVRGNAGPAQFMRPSGVVTSGGWLAFGAATLWEAMNDNDASDYGYSPSNPTGQQGEVNLSSVDDPLISEGHTLRVALEAEGQDTAFDFVIVQGTTALDSWSETVTLAQGQAVRPRVLSGAVIDAITNYGDVRFRFAARAP